MITTHVLDTADGQPASGIKVSLEVLSAGAGWTRVAWGTTDADGRFRELLPDPYLAEPATDWCSIPYRITRAATSSTSSRW